MPLPLATVADVAQIEAVRPFVQGRSCVLVGSAPLTAPIPIGADEVVIAVNGAISSVPRVDVWFLCSKEQDKPKNPFLRPLHKQMIEQGRGRHASHVVLLRGPKRPTEHYTLGWLQRLSCVVEGWSVLDKPTKRWLEGELCDRRQDNAPCSSGLLATACALWCEAVSVRLEGFSLVAGYHYIRNEPAQRWWRDHVDADRRALRALQARYPDRIAGAVLAQAVAA